MKLFFRGNLLCLDEDIKKVLTYDTGILQFIFSMGYQSIPKTNRLYLKEFLEYNDL